MLEYIKGQLTSVNPAEAVVETAGLGYLISISVNTYSAIQAQKEVKLLLHEIIREDTHDLFGFATAGERVLFRLLIGVSGVGANTARVILSSLTPAQLQACIIANDANKLKAVKGIGLKTAQRIIVDLKDKITSAELAAMSADAAQALTGPANEAFDEALAALIMLGYNKTQAQKALTKVYGADPTATIETAIKRSLSML